MARREKRGISPNHYCNQLSSYGFHPYKCITQSRGAKFLHGWYGELNQVQIELGCNCTLNVAGNTSDTRLCFSERLTKI